MSTSSATLMEPIKAFLLETTSSPLSKVAETVLPMVSESMHFQVALCVLLPMMKSSEEKLELRLQACFLLWFLYRNHSLDLNPFTIAFREALQEERSRNNGVSETTDYINGNPARRVGSDISPVLEMILSGKGFELAEYSPEALVKQWPFVEENNKRVLEQVHGQGSTSDDMTVARQLLLHASRGTLGLSEQKTLLRLLPSLPIPLSITENSDEPFAFHLLSRIVANNPGNIAYRLLSRIIAAAADEGREACWTVLRDLPPTLANLDLVTRLLRDATVVEISFEASPLAQNGTTETVGGLTRRHVLNSFLEHCVLVIEHMEVEERGTGTDGRTVELDPGGTCAIAIQHLCRFCLALLRSGNGRVQVVWGHEMGEDEWFGMTTIMRSFALRYVKFEGSSELYGVLTRVGTGRGG